MAVPLSFGAILGYATRARLWWTLLLLGLVIPGIVMSIITLNFAGFFCGFTLGGVFLLPASIGVLLGVLLRKELRKTKWDQRWFLPLLMLSAFPYAAELSEALFPRERLVATVETSLTMDATPTEAWQALLMYEQVEHEPQLLLKLALPKPIRSIGAKSKVGDVVRCIYDRGHICKQITEVVPSRRLAFLISEQHLHFEHDVKLTDGSFDFVADKDGKTKVTLTTRYERLLRPEAIWGPIERRVIHALHEHVLEGMRRKATRQRNEDNWYPPGNRNKSDPRA